MTRSQLMDLDATERFDRYVVLESLGRGGMAEVHRARQVGIAGFERTVALKRMLPTLASNPAFAAMFVQEATVASLLQHPNIVQISDLGSANGRYFIAMELVDGPSLLSLLRDARRVTGSPPPVEITVQLALELCDGLDHAHRLCDDDGACLGLIHRDISPSNLMIASSGHLKIIDFGIAKATEGGMHTKTGTVKGKFAYLAPEIWSRATPDARTDLFAVGVVLHEMLTARRLFRGSNEVEVIDQVRFMEAQPPSTINPLVPPALDEVVARALAKDPEQRWPCADELRRALEAVAAGFATPARPRDVAAWLTQFPRPATAPTRSASLVRRSSPHIIASLPTSSLRPPATPGADARAAHELVQLTPDKHVASEGSTASRWSWELLQTAMRPTVLASVVSALLLGGLGALIATLVLRGDAAEPARDRDVRTMQTEPVAERPAREAERYDAPVTPEKPAVAAAAAPVDAPAPAAAPVGSIAASIPPPRRGGRRRERMRAEPAVQPAPTATLSTDAAASAGGDAPVEVAPTSEADPPRDVTALPATPPSEVVSDARPAAAAETTLTVARAAPPARGTQPITIAPGVARKRSGRPVVLDAGGLALARGRTPVKLCVDDRGRVVDVKPPGGLPAAAARGLREQLVSWQYEPHLVDGRAVPVCFVMWLGQGTR